VSLKLDINDTIKNLARHKLGLYFGKDSSQSLQVNLKNDQTIVTDFDLSISELIKNQLIEKYSEEKWTFYSEEEHDELHFPACVLDPIDGTRELVKGRDECVVSLAYMNSANLFDPLNHGWIYNPFSGVEFSSTDIVLPLLSKSKQEPLGLISRSEWHLGLHSELMKKNPHLILAPRGSIAFKLALLAMGSCDFVVSFRDKSIWDVAAGTVLLSQRGYKFFEAGVEVKSLDKLRYEAPLLWVSPFHETDLLPHLVKST
jgi:fructose-1,6-bisphosphatase/inositol monophosphatase family enzyme